MTFEELLIAERVLWLHGYRRIWRYGRPPNHYCLRARKHPPLTVRGLREKVLVVTSPDDMAHIDWE